MDYKRVLTLHLNNGMNSREITSTTGDGKSAVSEFLKRFRECSELSYRLDRIASQLAAQRGITEHLKADDQMRWVQEMNNIQAAAEEIILREMIYSD